MRGRQPDSTAPPSSPTMKPTSTVLTADIRRIYAHLGPDTVVIEVEPGQPRFRLAVEGLPTLATSLTLAHQLKLAESSRTKSDIALALGALSGGLGALVFPDRAVLEVFLAANPALRSALRVEHTPGTVIFLRVEGAIPASRTTSSCTWLADGAILTLIVRARQDWSALPASKPSATPACVRFDAIDWRPLGDFGLSLLREVLTQQHGAPLRGSAADHGRLNLVFWAAFLSHALPLRHHAKRRQFQIWQPTIARWEDVSPAMVGKVASEAVLSNTRTWSKPYQPTPWETKQLVSRLRPATSEEVMDGELFFAACVKGVVECYPGANVTTKEALAVIETMHRKQGVAMPSATSSARLLKRLMKDMFGIPRSNNGHPEEGSSPFVEGDFIDLESVVAKFQQPTGPVYIYFRDQFSDATKGALARCNPPACVPASLRTLLAEEFNQVIRGELIFDEQRFRGVGLRPATERLIAKNSKNPQGDFLMRLNRLLLEDAFPKELARKYEWARAYQGVRLKARTAEPGGGLDALDTSSRMESRAHAVAISTAK
ncbi:MAG: hypothetical protein ABMA26_03410 [Limisphaerales bacterium]